VPNILLEAKKKKKSKTSPGGAGGGNLQSQFDVKDTEIKKHKDEAEKLTKQLKNEKEALTMFKRQLAQALNITPGELQAELPQTGLAGVIALGMAKNPQGVQQAANKAGVDAQIANASAPGGGQVDSKTKITKVIRSEIKPSVLDDAGLNKLSSYIEDLIGKAKEQSIKLQQKR